MIEYTPINSERAELCFLGSVAACKGVILDVFPITSEHFHTFRHRMVFETMRDIHLFGDEVTLDLTIIQLADNLEKVGGRVGIWDYFEYPTAAQAESWFEELDSCMMLRRAQELGYWTLQNANAESDDAHHFCSTIQDKASRLETDRENENELNSACDAMEKRLGQIERGERTIGLQTPCSAWNKGFGGLVEGCMYGLAGRPGTGKTALMEEISAFLAAHQQPVLIFERDMSPQMWVERVACRATRVPYWSFVKGQVDSQKCQKIRETISALRTLPIYLLSPEGMTAERMCSISRRYIRSKGVRAVFLDHMQVLRVGKDIREGLTKASITIRQTVTDSGVPHVCLLHLNRDGASNGKEPKRPTPENIKEFDQFYGDCDGLAILWTQAKAEELKENEKLAMKFYVAKNRNGPLGETDLFFDGRFMKFEEMTP